MIFALPNTTAKNEMILNDLMVINVELNNAWNIDLDKAVNKFTSMKTCRYPL